MADSNASRVGRVGASGTTPVVVPEPCSSTPAERRKVVRFLVEFDPSRLDRAYSAPGTRKSGQSAFEVRLKAVRERQEMVRSAIRQRIRERRVVVEFLLEPDPTKPGRAFRHPRAPA